MARYSSIRPLGGESGAADRDVALTRLGAQPLDRRTLEHRNCPWAVSDAPAYIAGQLRAIVGIEVEIDRVEANWKLSQNRSAEDVAGVIAGLDGGSDNDQALAAAMSKVEARRSDRGR